MIEGLIGKKVEVGVVGLVYRGRLREVDETEIHLESESGWLVIPASQVVFIREEGREDL